MKRRVLILGGSGFVGGHLQEHLQDCDVVAPSPALDVRDLDHLDEAVKASRPDWVFNLAAVSSVPQSFADPFETFDVNFKGTLNLLVSLRNNHFAGNLLYVGSSQVYGIQGAQEPVLDEKRLTRPINPYAVSKLAAEALCYQWSRSESFTIVMARPFNHIGPGQNDQFVVPNFAKQVLAIKRFNQPPVLRVGNIDVLRDFTDVRDVVRAYRLLIESGQSGESYNVCSGSEVSIRHVISELLRIASVKAEVIPEAGRIRATEQVRMCGTAEKLYRATGWKPLIRLEDSLKSILEHYDRALA